MKAAFGKLGVLTAIVAGFALMNGCKAEGCDDNNDGESDSNCIQLETLKRFDGTATIRNGAYVAGANVVIDSPNGKVRVGRGPAGIISAKFDPFTMMDQETTDQQAAAQMETLVYDLSAEGDTIRVDVDRPSGSSSYLGADMVVEIPENFSGTLTIAQNNGSTDVEFVGDAVGVVVNSDNGSCNIATGAAENVSIACGNGDLEASIAAVPATQSGTGFTTDNGEIVLALPADGKFSVQAQAHDGGTVQVNGTPSGCTVNAASESAKTVACNGATTADPIYAANAHGTGLANVVLNF
jgi:hypothetical protein